MNINVQALDSWFLARRPLPVSYSTIASTFFGVGIVLIVVDALFFEYFSSLAHTSFTTRRLIGYHFFFSELWFIFVGNALLLLAISDRRFVVPASMFADSRPIFITLGVYTIWFVYGALADNSWALQEFREMVFAALSLPPILYFATFVNSRRIFEKYIFFGTVLFLFTSYLRADLAALTLGSLFVAYFLLKLFYRSGLAVLGVGVASLPFVLSFLKPMIALFMFTVGISFVLAGYLKRESVNWILSRYKIRLFLVGLSLLMAILLAIALVNYLSGGAIETVVRWYFLKERVSGAGETFYGDMSGGRFAIWDAAVESWAERPLLGHGLGAEVVANASGWITKVQFHNYLIQALHNTGLVGCTLIIGSWVVWIRRSMRKVYDVRDTSEKIVLGTMLIYVFGILFFGLYGHALSAPPTALLFWLCVGFLSQPRHLLTRNGRP